MMNDASAYRSVIDGLNVIDDKIEQLGAMGAAMAQSQQKLDGDVAALANRIQELYDFSVRSQTVMWAETKLSQLTAERNHRFGKLDLLRDKAAGVVRAVQLGTIAPRSLTDAMSQDVLADGQTWIGPALQAFAAWATDEPQLAERAMQEAITRDDSRASLFFGFLTLRCGRMGVAVRWIKRYLECQYPDELDRDMVVVINAMTAGVFGQEALDHCMRTCLKWFEELSSLDANFEETQVQRWKVALDELSPASPNQAFPTLRRYSPTWPELEKALSRARRHDALMSFLREVFESETVVSNLTAAVDALLEQLVRSHVPDELAIARNIAELQLLIDHRGNEVDAKKATPRLTSLYLEKQDFAALLTTMAMHPETLRASDPAQRYAITLSQGWLLRASNNLTLRDRDETPQTIDLEIHGWKGSATHGSEDAQLSQSITRHFNALAAERGTLLKQPSAVLAPLVGFALVSWMGITSVISWIVILFIAGFLYMQYRAVQQAKGGSPDA